MRTLQGWLLPVFMLPMAVYAQEATVKEVHDAPAVRGSIIANMLQEHDNPFTLYPYDTNYIIYTQTSDLNKEAIASYDWAENARKDEVKFQLSLAFPLWRGILGPNSVLGASYTQKSWWQLSNSDESSPFRETNYEPQLFLGFATDYNFAGWTLRDVEMGYNHDSNGRSDPTSRSWNQKGDAERSDCRRVVGKFRGLRAIHHGAKPDVVAVFDYDAFDIRRFDSADAIIYSW